MNIFHRLGDWWERRRAAKAWKLDSLEKFIFSRLSEKVDLKVFGDFIRRIESLEQGLLESAKVPTGTANELKAIRIRLDQLELFVGLKREKKPQTVEGAARIG